VAPGPARFSLETDTGGESLQRPWQEFPAPSALSDSSYSAGQPWYGAEAPDAPQTRAEAQIDLIPLFARLHQDVDTHQSGKEAANPQDVQDPQNPEAAQGYHWKGLLWQSLAFIGIENAFRLGTDPYLRHLTAEGPYWTNYWISMQHWNMNRWSDGDDFLVDDIGHPMQGAVSGFIEIQNSPRYRNLQISSSSAYWKSRFIALLWMTAYSTQQKIGPLGEAAVGNDGGYTYPFNCPAPCTNPDVTYGTNTGWTDFIMTPAGGMVWLIGEDAIDRFISARLEEAYPDKLFVKIVRGSLNPTRTFANAMRWRNPWYRDYQHPDAPPRGIRFIRDDEEIIAHMPRYEIFPHFNALSLPINTMTCIQCRKWTDGGGVGFSARIGRDVDFDSDVNYQPNASPLPSARAGGNIVMATFGLRAGFVTPHYALKAAIRPGFVSYDHAYTTFPSATNPVPETGRITHFATALAINGDYGITRNFAIRGVFGNTPVRYLYGYLQPPGFGNPPRLNYLSKEAFLTNENWTYQVGPVLRF